MVQGNRGQTPISRGLRRASAADFSPDSAAVNGKDSKQWFVGVTVPVSAAGTVRASFVERETEVVSGGADAKVSQWALGYEHALSKRTALYAVYADIDKEEIGDRPRFRTFRSERNPPVDARGILSAGCGTRFARTVLACARNSPHIPGYGGDDGPVVGELQRALPASHS